jgi:hypothetical protein
MTPRKRRAWDRKAAYERKYGPEAAKTILRLLATIAQRGRK